MTGLWIPPERPKREKFRPLELRDADEREAAVRALIDLADAIGLNRGNRGIRTDGVDMRREAHLLAWSNLGVMLLGEPPEFEELC